MPDEVFISYSHKDREFVTKLASDLNRMTDGGVWFDVSDLIVGNVWRQEISVGIQNCKAFILVLSPDSVKSPEVRNEINQALQTHCMIIPLIYRRVKSYGELGTLVNEIQYIDLRKGSYGDNFQKLIDGLNESGARPFEFEKVPTNWGAVIKKIPGWAFAWGLGWLIFWFILALLFQYVMRKTDSPISTTTVFLATLCGGLGGFTGGLLAGIFTMLALQRCAPSINWKHMAPSIRVWALVGTGSVVSSSLVGYSFIKSFSPSEYVCKDPNPLSCMVGEIYSDVAQLAMIMCVVGLLIILFVLAAWFLTGVFAGWMAVRHIRRLEPGIGRSGAFWTSLGWGLGGLLGTVTTVAIGAGISKLLG